MFEFEKLHFGDLTVELGIGIEWFAGPNDLVRIRSRINAGEVECGYRRFTWDKPITFNAKIYHFTVYIVKEEVSET
jgi:hypothetical protein